MIQDIQDQIKNIKLEVTELHPLLHEVFSRHPSITRVEYTHGSNEKGADFILARQHEVLKREEYIGVVAKVGKIHQKLSSVQTQVQECLLLPRFLEQGKKEIYLSEVWVVASSTITPGAKAKIRAIHKSSKIHFVSGDDLAILVDECVPYYLVPYPDRNF